MNLYSYKIKHSVTGKEEKNPQYCQYCAIILLLLGGGFTNIVRIHSSLNLVQKYLSELSEWSEESNNIFIFFNQINKSNDIFHINKESKF